MTTADDICEELGFTVSEARSAAARVEQRKARLDEWHEVSTSFVLPDESVVYRFQRVVDTTSAIEYMIVDLRDEQIKLQEVTPPRAGSNVDSEDDDQCALHTDELDTDRYHNESVSFGPAVWLTLGQFMRHAEPQHSTDGDPVFAY